jgi:dTDP-glucose 4,6-dehydratase
MFVKSFWRTYNSQISVVRPSNAYGPRQHPEKLIPKFVKLAIEGDKLPLYGDGSQIRQWLHVNDLCDGIMKVIEEGSNEFYNLGGPDKLQNIEVAEKILDNLN